MLIKQLFAQSRHLLSLEIFPPKPDYPLENVYQTLNELYLLNPGFISVTYGAGGSNRGRTLEIAHHIHEYRIESVVHLTCIGHTRQEITFLLDAMRNSQIENILALRGDLPQGTELPEKSHGEFRYAHELISYIKSTANFSLGAAAYPEGHPESRSLIDDTIRLKEKVETGADYLITQLFLDNQYFYKFMERIRNAGIQVPVSAGIMPVLNGRIQKIIELSKATVPPKLAKLIQRYGESPEDMEKAGIEYAVKQIEELVGFGVEGIHLYTMNKVDQTKSLVQQIQTLL